VHSPRNFLHPGNGDNIDAAVLGFHSLIEEGVCGFGLNVISPGGL